MISNRSKIVIVSFNNDVSLHHAEMLMWPFFAEVAERRGYGEELYSLNLANSADATYASAKWILPLVI